MAMGGTLGTYEPDNLLAGDKQRIVMDFLTIESGQVLKRGSVLGLITSTGKAKLLKKSSTDGSQNFYAVLSENVNAESSDVLAPVYLTGEFNAGALIFGEETTANDIKASARMAGVFFKNIIK